MFQNLEMFKTAMSMARHAGYKQALTSQNVANADTPGYKARTVTAFADLAPARGSDFNVKATRPNHLYGTNSARTTHSVLNVNTEPNGNSVELETEILNSVDAKRQHDRALAIYQASLGMLRSALSKQ